MLSYRNLSWIGFFSCVSALGIAYFFMEGYLMLEPCPLCILDRLVVAAMACVFLVAALHNPGRLLSRAYIVLNGLFLTCGFVVSVRHLILQNRPADETASCLADAEIARNFEDILRKSFGAEADCAFVSWEFLGLTIPEQVLILFIFMMLLLILQFRETFR